MPIQYQLLPQTWLQLSSEVKSKLKEIFAIPKSGGVIFHQVGGKGIVESDGHTVNDLNVVTLEKMSQYLGLPETATDFWGTFDLVCDKVEGKEKMLVPPPFTYDKPLPATITPEPFDVSAIIAAVVGPPTEISAAIGEMEKQDALQSSNTFVVDKVLSDTKIEGHFSTLPFCSHCSSKGGRHKLDCTRQK